MLFLKRVAVPRPLKRQTFGFLFLVCLLLLSGQLQAQITAKEDFRGGQTPGIILGDEAYLTSGTDDEEGAGWLRLTKAEGNKKGYAYLDQSFPSNLGILVDFEYKMWRTNDDGHGGADGIGVFLFDGAVEDFKLGGYGGSLGYAPTNEGVDGGLSGGYIGIGLDAYGNFSNNNEGRIGGDGETPNSIALRGPASHNYSYIKGVQLGGSLGDDRNRDEIDYNTLTSERPSDEKFYRRVQLELLPIKISEEETRYRITVRWTKEKGGELQPLITHDATDIPPPETLKIGFAASTGGGFNYHELRNLEISTPGNLRVTKRADRDIMSTAAENEDNKITYTIEVVNDTDVDLDNIRFEDRLTDADGEVLDREIFQITDISYENFTQEPDLTEFTGGNVLSGILGLQANSTGRINVTGELWEVPAGNSLWNTTSVSSDDILDEDLGNNTASVETRVNGEGVDLSIKKSTNEPCWNEEGNTFTITVTNVGQDDLTYGSNQVVVKENLPSAVELEIIEADGWEYQTEEESGSPEFSRTAPGTLASGMSLPDITYRVKYGEVYRSAAEVTGVSGEGNTANNISELIGVNQRPAPPDSKHLYYFLDDEADILTAERETGNDLIWYYTSEGGAPSDNIRPSTAVEGTRTYYVSQSDGGCESELAEVKVTVIAPPSSGSLGGDQEICRNTVPEIISSEAAGQIAPSASLTYRWEASPLDSEDWQVVEEASDASFQPGSLTEGRRFRRISTAQVDGRSRDSAPTEEIRIETRICQVTSNPMMPSGRQ